MRDGAIIIRVYWLLFRGCGFLGQKKAPVNPKPVPNFPQRTS